MILGIDYGLRNIGLALAEENIRTAAAFKTFENKDIIKNLERLIQQKNVTKIIVGYPTKGNGEEGFVAKMLGSFLDEIKNIFPDLDIIKIDESMSTKIALENLRNLGYSKKSVEEMKDAEAARVILQTYLDNAGNSL